MKDFFTTVEMTIVTFPSTTIKAALFIVHSVLNDVEFTDLSCYKKHFLPLIVFSRIFEIMWTIFTTTNKTIFSLRYFEIDVVDIPEIQPAIEMIRSLKEFVLNTISHVRARKITFGDIEAILSGYEAYESVYNCSASVFGEVARKETILKEEIEQFKLEYDDLVSSIDCLLVTKPKNLPSLARLV